MGSKSIASAPAAGTLTITYTDATGQSKTVTRPVYQPTNGFPVGDITGIRDAEKGLGIELFDPGMGDVDSCVSKITYIDGDNGILRYRGYPIEQLTEQSSFLEVANLLRAGELPNRDQDAQFRQEIAKNGDVPEVALQVIRTSGPDAKPMEVLAEAVAAMGEFIDDKHAHLMTAKMPTLVAAIIRHRNGQKFIAPDPNLDYTENFLRMCFADNEGNYTSNPVLTEAMDKFLILHGDHEQNASTTVLRNDRSAGTTKIGSMVGAITALSGPAHGGANVAVLEMLDRIGSVDNIPAFLQGVKDGKERLMGFGHRVYKSFDPRAQVLKGSVDAVLDGAGKTDARLAIARELERIALSDDYFIKRKLFPNVDFYSGIAFAAMGYKQDVFTMLFALGRTPGWVAQLEEFDADPDPIARPRQAYIGYDEREYIPMENRTFGDNGGPALGGEGPQGGIAPA